jgi:hypothetical protein
MKVIRVATLVVGLCAGVTSVSAAQAPDQQGETPGRRMGGRILEGITLTDAQKTQQKVIREKYAPQMMQVRKTAQTTGTPPDEAKMADLRAAQIAELRAILTAEQQVIFDKNATELKARMAERKK